MKTWIDHLNNGELEADIEISTLCNAYCPQCLRYEVGLEKERDNFIKKTWSLEDFKKVFPERIIIKMKAFHLCGTLGDPILCDDLIRIVDYIVSINPNADIVIYTNGSARTEEWWWNLAITGGKSLRVIFDVDGINQEMHSKYRRNTNLEKILNNMEIVSSTLSRVETFTVVFKHNEKYLNEIKELTESKGSTRHEFTVSHRFQHQGGNRYTFTTRQGKTDILEKTSVQVETDNWRGHFTPDLEVSNKPISCPWNERKKIEINIKGQVFPCCFTNGHRKLYDGALTPFNNPENFSLFNRDLESVLGDGVFDYIIENLNQGSIPLLCESFCRKYEEFNKE